MTPILGVLTFPTISRGALRKTGQTIQSPGPLRHRTWPVASLAWSKEIMSQPQLCSKFQTCQKWPTSQHKTLNQSNYWHVYVFSFFIDIYQYICVYYEHVYIFSLAGYHCKILWGSPHNGKTIILWWGKGSGGAKVATKCHLISNPIWNTTCVDFILPTLVVGRTEISHELKRRI